MRKDKKYDELNRRLDNVQDELRRFAAIVAPDFYQMKSDIENIQEKLEQLQKAIDGFGIYY